MTFRRSASERASLARNSSRVSSRLGRRAQRCAALVGTAAAMSLGMGVAHGVDVTSWTATNGDWFTAGNWNFGVPTTSHQAYANNGGTVLLSSGNAVASWLGLGGSFAGPMGSASMVQSGGTLSLSDQLNINLGSSYTLTGGWINAVVTVANSSGAGVSRFVQSGGTANITSYLTISGTSPTNAEVQLDDGTINTGFSVLIGTAVDRYGSLQQNGGTVSATQDLILGRNFHGNGTYELNGGVLNTARSRVSYNDGTSSAAGFGTFLQTGGSHTTGLLDIGSNGLYRFTGGTLNVSSRFANAGTFDFGSAATTVSVGDGATVDLTTGTFLNASNGSLTIGSNTITTVPVGFDPNAVFGHFSTQGILRTPGSDIVIPVGTTMTLQGTWNDHFVVEGTLHATQGGQLVLAKGLNVASTGVVDTRDAQGLLGLHELRVDDLVSGNDGGQIYLAYMYVGKTTAGQFTHSGGMSNIRFDVNLGAGAATSGTLLVSGGTFSAGQAIVGDNGTGWVTQSDGQVTTQFVTLGQTSSAAKGTYQLSGGTLLLSAGTFSASLRLGLSGTGTFLQSGGTADVRGDLQMATNGVGSRGVYTLSGGTLTATRATIGVQGVGTITQSGASVANFGTLTTSTSTNAVGAYQLLGGTLNAGTIDIGFNGAGTFTQAGGVTNVTGDLRLSEGTGSALGSTYSLQDGTLTARREFIGRRRAARFEQSGGVNNCDFITIFQRGQYVFTGGARSGGSGGTLLVGKNMVVSGGGTINFAGSNGTLIVADGASAFLSGATLLNANGARVVAGASSLLDLPAGFDPQVFALDTAGIVHISGTPLALQPGQSVGGSGTITGQTSNSGTLRPGNSAGTLAIVGDLTQFASGVINIELGNGLPGENDVLQVSGAANLAGRLDVSVLPGFANAPRQTQRVLRYGSHTGTLALNNATGYPGVSFTAVYDDTGMDLTSHVGYGDANLDGRVTFDDYVRIDLGFNNQWTGWANGDFNGNGVVNFDDYVIIDIAFNNQVGTTAEAIAWLNGDRSESGDATPGVRRVIDHVERFGTEYSRSFLAAVPEPIALTPVACLALARRRRRRVIASAR